MNAPVRSLFGMLIGLGVVVGASCAPVRISAAFAASPSATPTIGTMLRHVPLLTPSPTASPFSHPDPLVTPIDATDDWVSVDGGVTHIPIYRIAFSSEVISPGTRFAHEIFGQPSQIWLRYPMPEQLRAAMEKFPTGVPTVFSYMSDGPRKGIYAYAYLMSPKFDARAREEMFTVANIVPVGPMAPPPGFGTPSPSPIPSGSGGAPVSGHGSSGSSPVGPPPSASPSP